MIGNTVYVFDMNRRVYRKDGVGAGPIWREHWRPEKVSSETSRSWVTDHGTKIPKKGHDPRSFAFSLGQIESQAWVQEHRYKISSMVERCLDPVKLQQIAEIVGYQRSDDIHGEGT